MEDLLARRATFRTIKQSTKADWDIIIAHHMPFAARLADGVCASPAVGACASTVDADRPEANTAHSHRDPCRIVTCHLQPARLDGSDSRVSLPWAVATHYSW